MAYHEQQYKRRISLAQANNALIALISINVIIFIILASLKAIFLVQYRNNEEAFNFFNTHVLNQFSLAAQPEKIISRTMDRAVAHVYPQQCLATAWEICCGCGCLVTFSWI
jgi:hypothetical protein